MPQGAIMNLSVANGQVIERLESTLEAFLDEHKRHAQNDPRWVSETEYLSEREQMEIPGCGCNACIDAERLLGRI